MKTLIPPDKNAVISRGKFRRQNPGLSLRNKALIDIQRNILEFNIEREAARKKWKVDNNYHQRSKSAFYRLKIRLGDKLSSRKSQNQLAESLIKCKILNRFAA